MKATHSVKINGIWYKAGEEISPAEKPIAKPIAKETGVIETPVTSNYTRREITFMKVDDLRELAKAQGIDGAEDMTGATLKPLLIEKLGL